MVWLQCPYLGADVELTDEREHHIRERHPDLPPDLLDRLEQVLADPDVVRRSNTFAGAHLFSRWYDDVKGGKHLVIVVAGGTGQSVRKWIVTSYLAWRLGSGEVVWKRTRDPEG